MTDCTNAECPYPNGECWLEEDLDTVSDDEFPVFLVHCQEAIEDLEESEEDGDVDSPVGIIADVIGDFDTARSILSALSVAGWQLRR